MKVRECTIGHRYLFIDPSGVDSEEGLYLGDGLVAFDSGVRVDLDPDSECEEL